MGKPSTTPVPSTQKTGKEDKRKSAGQATAFSTSSNNKQQQLLKLVEQQGQPHPSQQEPEQHQQQQARLSSRKSESGLACSANTPGSAGGRSAGRPTISTAAKTTTKRPANPGKSMPTVTSNGEQPTALPDNFTYVLCNRSNNDEASSSSSTIQQLPKKLKNTKVQSAEEEDMDTDVSTSSVEEVMLAENATNNAQEEESEEQQNDGFTIKKSRRQHQRTSSQTQGGHAALDSRRRSQATNERPNATHTLAAIKLHISNAVADSYSSTVAIAKEIDRCMSGKLNIKFASLKGNLLIIATDDAASHAKLSGDWPADAFTKGVKPIVKQAKDTARLIIIKGVELSIALDDDYVLSQLRDQHALSPTRIINKKTGAR